MNDRFKDLTIKLSKIITLKSYKFLMDNLEEEEITDIINLVLSSHISSLMTCMMEVASGYKEHTHGVEELLNSLRAYLSSLDIIKNVEVMNG